MLGAFCFLYWFRSWNAHTAHFGAKTDRINGYKLQILCQLMQDVLKFLYRNGFIGELWIVLWIWSFPPTSFYVQVGSYYLPQSLFHWSKKTGGWFLTLPTSDQRRLRLCVGADLVASVQGGMSNLLLLLKTHISSLVSEIPSVYAAVGGLSNGCALLKSGRERESVCTSVRVNVCHPASQFLRARRRKIVNKPNGLYLPPPEKKLFI